MSDTGYPFRRPPRSTLVPRQPRRSVFGGELEGDEPTNGFAQAVQRGPAPSPEPIPPHDPSKPVSYENLTGFRPGVVSTPEGDVSYDYPVPSREMATSVANRAQVRPGPGFRAVDAALELGKRFPPLAPFAIAGQAALAGGTEMGTMSKEERDQAGLLGTAMRGAGAATSRATESALQGFDQVDDVWDKTKVVLFGEGADERTTDKAATDAAARAAARRGQAAEDPPGKGTNDPSLTAPKPEPGESPTATTYRDRVKAVQMPNGRVIFTNVPDDSIEKGGKLMDYDEAVRHVRGKRAGFTMGGAAPSGDPRTSREALASPPTADFVGFENVARTGTHNTETLRHLDPTIQQYEADKYAAQVAGDTATRMEEREKRDKARDVAMAQADQNILAARIDPLAAAKLEAESKYGGDIIEAEAESTKIAAAVKAVGLVTEQINIALRGGKDPVTGEVLPPMKPGPERDAHIKRLEE